MRGDLVPLLRFYSTKEEGETLISLADYAGRMAEGQEAIYYVLAGDLESARQSPHLEALAARDLEALLLTDVFDSVMLEGLSEYEGKPLKNLDDPDLALPGDDTGAASRVDDEASKNSVQRTGTSLSSSLVMRRSRRAEAFQAMSFGGSLGT